MCPRFGRLLYIPDMTDVLDMMRMRSPIKALALISGARIIEGLRTRMKCGKCPILSQK